MKRKRFVVILALGLFLSSLAGPAQAAPGDSASGASEVRLPVTPPPARDQKTSSSQVRQVRLDINTRNTPAAPDFSKGVEIPTVGLPALPVFDEKQVLAQIAPPPPPPVFPGISTNGPELRMGVTPPGQVPGQGNFAPQNGLAVPGASGQEQWNLAADRIIGQHGS